MSQHDFDIANQGFAAFRADLNNALKALGSLSSGTEAPTTTYANQLWYETDTNILHIRNEANSAWLDLMVIDQTTGSPSFTAGNVGIGTSSPVAKLDVQTSGGKFLVDAFGGSSTQIGTANGSGSVFRINGDARLDFYVDEIERARIDASGNVGIGTSSPEAPLHVVGDDVIIQEANNGSTAGPNVIVRRTSTTPADNDYLGAITFQGVNDALAEETYAQIIVQATDVTSATEDGSLTFWTTAGGALAERARIFGGTLLIAKTSTGASTVGIEANGTGLFRATRDGGECIEINRLTNDGDLVIFRQAGNTEGTISVSGTTVSYNGGHLSRWAQFPDNSRPELLKGTVMSNLDQMSNWDNEDNEQLNCVQVSIVEGDANVAGVFVAWDTTDDDYNDILLGMTGDMVIRIAGGTTVQRGDLLMSAGDGTAKPQGDDIVRSKTIAKVTSTHVSHTYADGSYAVPCVLMAC